MDYIEQFVTSFSFQLKKIGEYRNQSIWKSICYVIILVLLAGIMTSVYRISKSNEIKTAVLNLPDDYVISREGATALEEMITIRLPQIEMLLVMGSLDVPTRGTEGLRNVIALGEDGWVFGRIGFPLSERSYSNFPFLSDEQEEINKAELIQLASEIDEQIRWFTPLYHYASIFIDLVGHFVLISLLAVAGRGFRKMIPLTYKQVWTITAYGISAPIVVRTLIQLIGLNIGMVTMLYWLTVAFFSISVIRHLATTTK